MVHALFSQDGCQRDGFWEVVGRMVFPFELSQTLPVGGGLLVPCSLAGPPVMKQPCKWLLWSLARVDGFSQRASPNSREIIYHCFVCCVLVAQSCPTLCNPRDYSSPGSSVHGNLQARILEWVAISFSIVCLESS